VKSLRFWKIAALVAAVVAAMGWASAPATSHVAGWAHNWTEHIKPRTDARYYTKTASNSRYYTKAASDARYTRSALPLGASMSGVWTTAAPSGNWSVADFNFRPVLPGGVVGHYVTTPTSECPGAGQAAAGHLCVYETWNYNLGFQFFDAPGPAGTARTGLVMYMFSNAAEGNARGNWTVRAPLVAGRVVAPAPRVGSSTTGR
jgi:hypothetical protein